MSSPNCGGAVTLGCLGLVALVFTLYPLLGLGAALLAYDAADPAVRISHLYFTVVVQLFFAAIGLVLCYIFINVARSSSAEVEQKRERPDEPWTANSNWDKTTRAAGFRNAARVARLCAGFYLTLCAPMLVVLPMLALEGTYDALGTCTFALCGIMVWRFSRQSTRRYVRYGEPCLALRSGTGFVGGHLSGSLNVPRGLEDGDEVDVVLRCTQIRTYRSGDTLERDHDDLWRYVARVPAHYADVGEGVCIDFTIPIPDMLPPTGPADQDRVIGWDLIFSRHDDKVSMVCPFTAPIYSAPADHKAETSSVPTPESNELLAGYDPRVFHITPLKGSGYLTRSRAWRHPVMASIYMTLLAFSFSVFWSGLFREDQSEALGVCAAGSLFCLVFFYLLWEHATHVETRVHRGEIQVNSRFLFWRSRDTLLPKDILSIEARPARSRTGNRDAFNVVLSLASGLFRIIIPQILSKQDAERLARTLQEAFSGSETGSKTASSEDD